MESRVQVVGLRFDVRGLMRHGATSAAGGTSLATSEYPISACICPRHGLRHGQEPLRRGEGFRPREPVKVLTTGAAGLCNVDNNIAAGSGQDVVHCRLLNTTMGVRNSDDGLGCPVRGSWVRFKIYNLQYSKHNRMARSRWINCPARTLPRSPGDRGAADGGDTSAMLGRRWWRPACRRSGSERPPGRRRRGARPLPSRR